MSIALSTGALSESRLLIGVALCSAYIGALVILFRWFSASRASHVLPVESSRPPARSKSTLWRQSAVRLAWIPIAAGALLIAEINALVQLATVFVPGVQCDDSWLSIRRCTMGVETSILARHASAFLLSSCILIFLVISRLIRHAAYFPFSALALGIVAFAAGIDVLVGINEPARSSLIFRVSGVLALTAAAGFTIGALILRAESILAYIRAMLAHVMAALIRILGALALLMLWPFLPPASAVAIIILLIVPGVATALTAAAVLSLAPGDEQSS